MFVFLSKILPILVYPTSLIGIVLLLALRTKSARSRKRFLITAVGILWILGNSWVADGVVRSLEWRFLPQETYPQADAIVILGGATYAADYPRATVEVSGAADRILYGANLFKAGYAPWIVVTGGNLPWTDSTDTPASEMFTLLVGMGVPAENILQESVSVNTYENAVQTLELLEPLGFKRIILVTSALHMPRSVPLFENQGFTVYPAPTDYGSTRPENTRPLIETWPDQLIHLFPGVGALGATTAAMKEYIGITIYWLRGWW